MRESLASATKSWRAATAADTEAFGAKLAAAMLAARSSAADAGGATSSDALVVIYLTGDLGAGKTTLARGFLHAIGITEPIRSPTYTLLETYEASGLTLAHLDLYRLRDPDELEPLGLRDLARPSFVWLIEWAERGAGWLPPADVELRLSVDVAGHRIEAHAASPFGAACLSRIAA